MIQNSSRWKVFSIFAKNPTKTFHIRELSRMVGLAATSINIHIKELEKDKLISKEKIGIYITYKAEFDSDYFRFYKKIYNIISLKESGLVAKLEDTLFPTTIILFGSYMKGEDIETSDVDLFIAAKEKDINLKKYEKIIGRKIQLFFNEDINKLPKELRNNILNGIVVSGYIKVF